MEEKKLATVLVVEFDRLQRDLMVLALKRDQMNPVVCDDLTQIRQLIIEHQPDVVLLDLYLPGTNGLNLMKTLFREGLLTRRSTIAISSLAFPEVVQQAISIGVDDFLIKPFTADLLLARIHKILSGKSPSSVLSE